METAGSTPGYQLSDELARLCLPAEFRDEYRTLAWVNSVCFLFLVIGLVGLKPPKVVVRPLAEVAEPIAVELPPPQEQPQVQTEVQPDDTPQDTSVDAPQVAVVVAAADPSQVAFAVPVVGAVGVKEARFATPPPAVTTAAPKPIKFDPNASVGGIYPPPDYPGFALRNRYQGTVTVELKVEASGNVTSAGVQRSSGYPVLDEAARSVVKNRWRFPPGEPRLYLWECKFQIN